MRMTRRLTPAAVAATALLSIGHVVLAQPRLSITMPELLPYVKPSQLVDIGGRRINLVCAGVGGPTVILMAGLASWSLAWFKTQPSIARHTRVCGFDRAGFGFSDPAPQPQILSDVVDDLHTALKSGAIQGPFVLVGHSLGGVEARLYAQRWPQEVVGMVLVDTSSAAEGLMDEDQPGFDEAIGQDLFVAKELHCALLAAHGPLEPSNPEYKDCSRSLPSDTPAAFRKIWPQFFTAYYAADKISLLFSVYTHRYDSVDHGRLGAMPLVVLSAQNTFDTGTPLGVRFNRSYSKLWFAMHEALAHLSSRGAHRIIRGSGHEIQFDKPQAVVDAVDEVLRELKTGAKS